MAFITDLLLAIPVAGIILFFVFLITWLVEDVIPPWRNATPIGSYEAWLTQGATNIIRRRKRNFVDLTEMAFDRKEGAILIEKLIEGMKDPGFHMPAAEKQSFIEALGKISGQYPLVEVGNFRLKVIGIGSMLSRAQVVIALLDKRISFPEGYVYGQSRGAFTFSGWRSRRYIMGRQFFFPKRQKKFLGKRKVRMSVVSFTPPAIDEKSRAEELEALRRFTTDAAPIVPLMAQSHIYEDKLRVDAREIAELKRQVDTANQSGFSNVAGGVAAKTALGALGNLLGFQTKPVRGALPAVVLILGPVLGDVLFQYGFNTNPLFGVMIGSILSVFLMTSR